MVYVGVFPEIDPETTEKLASETKKLWTAAHEDGSDNRVNGDAVLEASSYDLTFGFLAAGDCLAWLDAEGNVLRKRPLEKPLTALETSALCTSLAKGCEKQYQQEQADAFRQLAAWFAARGGAAADPSFEGLLDLVNADLEKGYPAAETVSRENGDRGAQRSLVWSGKVTRILKALLERYAREGDAMTENTGVYVCTICGFVYIGDDLPEVCPVCRVPNRKFEKIGG